MAFHHRRPSQFLNALTTRLSPRSSKKALKIALDTGDRRLEEHILGALGIVYRRLGEPRRAIEYYGQALAIAREIRDRRNEGIDLWNMSLALDQLGERKKAIEHAEAALKIKEKIEDPYAAKVRERLDSWRNG